MKTVLSTSIAALAVAILPFSANAADVYNQGSTKDAPYDGPISRPAFVGLGVGIHGGGQFTNIDLNAGGFAFDGVGADGLVGGIHAEYLFALGQFRVGPYAEGGFSNVNTEISFGGADADILNQESYFGGGVKAGMVFGSALVYGRAGYEWSQWGTDLADIDIDVESLVVGGGVEAMIARNVSIGLSADYLIPLNVEAAGIDVTDYVEDSESVRVLARITYRQ
jgi:hypothetical protein